MQVIPNNMTVADYCAAVDRRDITVNRDYQRSDKVWPMQAQSFLIETMLLGYPMPKLSLHQVTDLKSRATVKEIIDGQQRTQTICAFYKGDLRLSRTLALSRASGRTYPELDEDLQAQFLGYPLSIDLLVAASKDDVREVFRRINSYTVPLNPEEQRHAIYQGPFKWFVHRFTRDFSEAFVRMGIFKERQLIRMADAKLVTEVCHALLYGITTTNTTSLNALYRSRDTDFPEELGLDRRLREAMDFLVTLEELYGTELMKPYQFYSLLLAVIHRQRPVDLLEPIVDVRARAALVRNEAVAGLLDLVAALEEDYEPARFQEFLDASTSRTNVKQQRELRFSWDYSALAGRPYLR